MNTRTIIPLYALCLVALLSSARAQSIENFTEFFGSSAAPLDPSSDFPITLTAQQFNSDLGNLVAVGLTLTATVNGEVNIYNLTSQSQGFTNAFVGTEVSVTGPNGTTVTDDPMAFVASGTANPGLFVETVFQPDMTAGNGTGTNTAGDPNLSPYESPGGTGVVYLTVNSNGSETVGGSSNVANTLAFAGIVNVYGDVDVQYSYFTPVPETPEYAAYLGAAVLGFAFLKRARDVRSAALARCT